MENEIKPTNKKVTILNIVLIIIIFVSITASIMYSLYISTTETKRNAIALNYAVDIFEKVGSLQYDDVSGVNILSGIDATTDINEEDNDVVTAKIRKL